MSESRSGGHLEALRRLGVGAVAEKALLPYLDLLAAWSRRVNLTGARTAQERVLTLVGPVLGIVPLVPEGTVLDLGSGNGSPGLVLALLRPDLEVTLVEPRARRAAFLREAARATGRGDVEVFRGRHDAWPGPPARTVLLRALRLPLAEIAPLVAPGGAIIVLGRPLEPSPGFVAEPTPVSDRHLYRRST